MTIIQLTKEDDSFVREYALNSLSALFPYIPDKKQGWADIIQLMKEDDSFVRGYALNSLSAIFPYIPDKKQAWADLIQLTKDENMVQFGYLNSLGAVFIHLPDKNQAWNDIHQLIKDKNKSVRLSMADALATAFPYIPDKKQAWDDLIKLSRDEDSEVRRRAAEAFSPIFEHPIKLPGFKYLGRRVAEASSFISNKKQVGYDSIKLTRDEDSAIKQAKNISNEVQRRIESLAWRHPEYVTKMKIDDVGFADAIVSVTWIDDLRDKGIKPYTKYQSIPFFCYTPEKFHSFAINALKRQPRSEKNRTIDDFTIEESGIIKDFIPDFTDTTSNNKLKDKKKII